MVDRTDPTSLTGEEREIVGLLERALDLANRAAPHREDVVGHIEAAIRSFRQTGTGIPPDRLNSANDG